jgi:flagellar protein FlaI
LGLLDRLRRNGKNEVAQKVSVHVEQIKKGYEVIEEYFVHNPIARIKIVKSPQLGEGLHYFTVETPLNEEESDSFRKIMDILSKEMEPPTDDEMTPEEYVLDQAERVAEKYYRALGGHSEAGWRKIFYYVVRELIGYGPLHAIMLDPNIEDISSNGVNSPIYAWHRKYESIPTNITFIDEQATNDFIVKLAHRSSKHISSATPLLDGMLPEKHRLAATFMNEVSMKGSTFCIRKFRKDPFSIVDLINIGTLDEKIAAYFWLILENKMNFMIIGGTGAGKTSILNSVLSLMSRNDKIVTVEEVAELSPPLPNWTQLNSRHSFQFGQGAAQSISIFDLVKVSLRYRPDYIIVGEIRGEEAFTLFQALATGHGGLCTMHADSLNSVIKRLTSPPMNVSKVYIPLMNNALHIQRVELPKAKDGLTFGRRVRTIWEIEDYDQYREVAVWNPRSDTFETWFENSFLLEKIAATKGVPKQDLLIELEKRREYLAELVENDIRDQEEVAERILAYYTHQRENSRKEQDTKKRRKLSVKRKRYLEEIKKEARPEDVIVEGGGAGDDLSAPSSPHEDGYEPGTRTEPLPEEDS